MKKIHWLLLGMLVLSLALAGCGPGGAAEEEAAEPRTIIIGTTDEISSLDYSDAYSVHDWELMRSCNVTLLGLNPVTSELELGTAADWPEISDGGLTYTFTLSDGWAYPDGTPLVAGDYARTINRALLIQGDVAGLVSPYVEYAEAPDDQTVVYHLLVPRGDFMQMVTASPYMPTPEGFFPEEEMNRYPDTLIGVGPWQIVEYDVEEQTVLEHNPNYKLGFSENAPDRVIVRYFEDATSMALAIENGEIDISWRLLGPPEVQRLGEVEGLTTFDTGGGGIRYLVPNYVMAPFDDINVRQAVAYLVDRDEIVDRVMQGTVAPLYSQVPPGFLGANEAFLDIYHSPDIAAAEELLAASGYTEDAPLAFDLWYPPEHYGTHAAQIFQVLEAQLEATPLIQVNLQVQEWGTYVHDLTDGAYPIGYLGWFYDYPDTSNYLDVFALCEASDDLGISYCSEEMDAMLLEAGSSFDQAQRAEIYDDAQVLYAEDVVTIPLIIETEFVIFRNETVSDVTNAIGPALQFRYELIELP